MDEQCEFVPILVPDSDTFTAIAVSVSSAGNASSVLRLGIYEDDGGVPGDLVVDGGTVAADSTGDKTTSISEALSPGLYWLAVVPQGATSSPPTVRAGVTLGAPHVYNSFTQLRAAMHYRTSSSVAAALPDPAGTLTYQNSAVPVVSLQRTS